MSSFPSGFVLLCCLETSQEYTSCFGTHWGNWINLDSLIKAHSMHLAKPTRCVYKHKAWSRDFQNSSQETFMLGRQIFWGHRTQLYHMIVLIKLTSEISDLSNCMKWMPSQDVLPRSWRMHQSFCWLVPKCSGWIGLLPRMGEPMGNILTVDWFASENENNIYYVSLYS